MWEHGFESRWGQSNLKLRAFSSVVERHIDIVKAIGSIPIARTTIFELKERYFADETLGASFLW